MAEDYESLDKDELIKRLRKLESRKGYGLKWSPSPENIIENYRGHVPILRPVNEKRLRGDGPEHILIEGENFHALQILSYTHEGSIDLIYIDPPYNTGNKDFIYNDSYVDSEDSFRHSKWLSFMSKRLKLAKYLLKPEGAIVISIDDNEFAQLKLLCDNIFGEKNFIDCIPWQKKSAPKGVPPASMIVNTHEYLLVYGRSDAFAFIGEPRDESEFPNDDDDGKGPYKSAGQNIKSTISQNEFTITNPSTGDEFTDTWAYSETELNRMIDENEILWPSSPSGQPRSKEYLHGYRNPRKCLRSEWISGADGDSMKFSVQSNTEMFKAMVPNSGFLNPKPIKLLEYLISVICEDNATILDFFAGTGTTCHAVMNLNAQDGGNRRCILCTNNEGQIAEEITYPRLKAVTTGWEQKGKQIPGISASLVYSQIEYLEKPELNDELMEKTSTCIMPILQHKHNTFNHTHMDKEKVWTVKSGMDANGEPIHSVVIANDEHIPAAVEYLEANEIQNNVHFFVFSYGKYAFEAEFPPTEIEYTLEPYPENFLATLAKAHALED